MDRPGVMLSCGKPASWRWNFEGNGKGKEGKEKEILSGSFLVSYHLYDRFLVESMVSFLSLVSF